MCTALVKLDLSPQALLNTVLSPYEKAVLTGKLPVDICNELDNEEWSKPYSDVDKLFSDLGLYD